MNENIGSWMPADIKKAIIALVLSAVFMLLADYFTWSGSPLSGYSLLILLAVNLFWMLILSWIITDLIRGNDPRWALIAVGLLTAYFVVADIRRYGFGLAEACLLAESALFFVAYFLVRTKSSAGWFLAKQ